MRADDAWSAVLELAASQHGSFHRRQAAAHQLSNRRLARGVANGELVIRAPDVFRLISAPTTWKSELMVVSLAGGAASHRAAAALHGLDGVRPGVFEVSVPRGLDKAFPLARIHRWSYTNPADLTCVDGIRVTSVPRTLVQLGRVLQPSAVEKALDSALRLGHPLGEIERTLHRLWRPGPTGAGVLRAILEDPSRSKDIPDSWFERVLCQLIRAQTDLAPVLQHTVACASGPRRLDLAFPKVKLAVEAHSKAFHFGPAKGQQDIERHLELAAEGWQVVYVTWTMTKNPAPLIDLITRTHAKRRTQMHRTAS